MQFLDNMKVAAKVAFSSGSILALLLLSAAISVWGLSSAMDNYSTYRSLARRPAADGEDTQHQPKAPLGVKHLFTLESTSERWYAGKEYASTCRTGFSRDLLQNKKKT